MCIPNSSCKNTVWHLRLQSPLRAKVTISLDYLCINYSDHTRCQPWFQIVRIRKIWNRVQNSKILGSPFWILFWLGLAIFRIGMSQWVSILAYWQYIYGEPIKQNKIGLRPEHQNLLSLIPGLTIFISFWYLKSIDSVDFDINHILIYFNI